VEKEYVNGRVAWEDFIPSHWEIYRFRQLFNFGRGISITKADLQDEGIPCVTYGDIHSRFGFELKPEVHTVRCVDGRYATTNPNSMLRIGDFVFADTSEDVAGSGNFTYLNSDRPTIAGYHTVIARPQIPESSRFLAYVFDSVPFRAQIGSKVYGIKVFSITQAILKNASIPLPPIAEQKQIIAYLDRRTAEIDSLLADLRSQAKMIEKYRVDVITNAVMHGIVSTVTHRDSGLKWVGKIPAHWQISRMSFEAWVRARLGWKGLKAEEYVDDGYVFLSTPNIKDAAVDYENVNYITKERYDESPEIKLRSGDVLLAKDGSTLGTVNVVRQLPREATVNSSIAVITPKERLNGRYLMYFFKGGYIQNVIQSLKDGMGVPHLFQRDINKMKILLPPVEEQEQIADYLDAKTAKIEGLIADITAQIEKLKQYRQIVIHDAVTGKIKVTEG
jgi:type I restriction enzyme S subunit